MRIGNIIKDILIILMITVGLFVAAEITLRVLFPEKKGTSVRSQSLAYEFNKDYLVSLKPNIEKIVTKEENGSYTMYWKTNSNSFRGNELKKNPKPRIIVYGDSSIEARFSTLENTFVYKLEKYLREKGMKNVEAINAGVVGFGPDQSLIRLVKEIDIYHPDIVVFSITTHNDYGDIIRNRLFELDPNGNLVETAYEKSEDVLLREKERSVIFFSSLKIIKMARKIKRRMMGKDLCKSKVNDPAESLIQQCNASMEREYSVYKQSEPRCFSIFADGYDLDIAVSPDAESSKTKLKLMDGVIRKAKSIADKKGIGFVVLIIPSIIDMTKNYLFSYENLKKYPGYRETNLTDGVKNICISNHVDFVDLFEIFSRNNPEDLFFKNNNAHWNDQGQDIAAKESAQFIANKIIPEKRNLPN